MVSAEVLDCVYLVDEMEANCVQLGLFPPREIDEETAQGFWPVGFTAAV